MDANGKEINRNRLVALASAIALEGNEGGLIDRPLELGERVRVTKGVLAGVEGFVLELRGRTYVVVRLLDSWFAKASVPRAWLEPVGTR